MALTGAILTTGAPAAEDGGDGAALEAGGLDPVIDSAAVVVIARFDRLGPLLAQPRATAALCAEFAALLPFLP